MSKVMKTQKLSWTKKETHKLFQFAGCYFMILIILVIDFLRHGSTVFQLDF
jgi:hypothetical protein